MQMEVISTMINTLLLTRLNNLSPRPFMSDLSPAQPHCIETLNWEWRTTAQPIAPPDSWWGGMPLTGPETGPHLMMLPLALLLCCFLSNENMFCDSQKRGCDDRFCNTHRALSPSGRN